MRNFGLNKRWHFSYYRSELKESNGGYTWVATDEGYIIEHTRRCEQLQAHYRSYDSIHKGQLCVFNGYAIDPNGDLKKPSTLEPKSMLDHRTQWYFNPWSFKVSLLNEDTIDDFVEKTPISKEMTQKMVLHYKSKEKERRQTKRKKFVRNFFDKISKVAPFVEKKAPSGQSGGDPWGRKVYITSVILVVIAVLEFAIGDGILRPLLRRLWYYLQTFL